MVFSPSPLLTGDRRVYLKLFPKGTVVLYPIPISTLKFCSYYHPMVLFTDFRVPAARLKARHTQNPTVQGGAPPVQLTQMGPCWVGSNLLFLTFLPEYIKRRFRKRERKATILIRWCWGITDSHNNEASSRVEQPVHTEAASKLTQNTEELMCWNGFPLPHEITNFGEDQEKLQIIHFQSQIGLIPEVNAIANWSEEKHCRIAPLVLPPEGTRSNPEGPELFPLSPQSSVAMDYLT